jgi:serine/threonine protein kinase
MTDEAQDLPRGARLLDRYTILERVADGGMATIHTAVDDRFDRVVCVKLLRVEIGGPGSTGSNATGTPIYLNFLQEALALSKLQHPNTLRIYDFGYLEGGQRPFQVSEFLDGGNLRTHVRNRGALSVEETLAILERITGAIAEAHGREILHRDIKPSNILFAHVGDVLMPKLADFGIARTILARRSVPDVSDGVDASVGMYSPRWAAPEQLRAEPEGPYTDVYALGLVTAYMLSGVNPFDATHFHDALEERARSDEVIQRRMAPVGLPSSISRVLMRAVTADPGARTSTPTAFFEDLRHALGGARTSLPSKHAEPRKSGQPPPSSSTPSRPSGRGLPVPVESKTVSGRQVRIIQAYEKLDLDLVGDGAVEVRFRVSIVPEQAYSFRIQIKGLNCFISKVGASGSARPTPAISASEDGMVEFVSTGRKVVGRIAFAFGRQGEDLSTHVFATAGGDVVVPSLGDSFALALDFGPDREIIVMCSKRG